MALDEQGIRIEGRGRVHFASTPCLPRAQLAVKVLAESARLYFFLDGEALAEEGEEFVMRVGPGRHVLACSDAEGRTAKVSFECVREAE